MEPKRDDIDSSTSRDNLLYGKKQFKFNRKGQVTIFIIVGILILAAAGAVFFISRSTITERLTAEGEPVIMKAPIEFFPFQQFTENCLIDVGKQGLLLLGEQGGYIYPDLVGKYSVGNPTDAEGIDLEQVKVPYWHYNKEPNAATKISFASLQPKLSVKEDKEMSIEAQLGRFVNEKLDGCLRGYSAFKGQGYDVEVLSLPDTTVHVTDTGVQFSLQMDVEASRGETTHSFDQFYNKVPLNLKEYYEIADQITAAQRSSSFLEKQGLELLSVYSGLDPFHFPPFSEVTFEYFSPFSWNQATLEQQFKEVLTSYVPMLRFLGSKNFYHYVYPEGKYLPQKIVDNTVLALTGAENLEVSFDYLAWPLYFVVNSGQGTIEPENTYIKFMALSFGQQRYETHYDASYPVLVSLHDPTALDGRGYLFTFALESNIRNNRIPEEKEVVEPVRRAVSGFSCGEEYKTTAPLKTVVVDSFTKEPVEAVRIGFTIPDQGECPMGFTDPEGELTTPYPAVYGGIINFIQDGYLTNFYPIDTYKYRDKPLVLGYANAGAAAGNVIEIDKIIAVPVTVKKKELKKCLIPLEPEYTVAATSIVSSLAVISYKDISTKEGTPQCFFNQGQPLLGFSSPALEVQANNSLSRTHNYYFTNVAKELSPDEKAFVTLERVQGFQEQVQGEEFTATVSVTGNQPVDVNLVPGIYKVSGAVTLQQQVTIPSERRCFAYSLFILGDREKCVDLDGSTADNYVEGNLQWETPETYIRITPEELYTAKGLTFYVLTQDILSIPEQVKSKSRKCAGWVCVPYVGCAGESCDTEEIAIAGRVVEDLIVPAKIQELANRPEIREALLPKFQ